MPRHFLLCEIVEKGHERAQGLYKCPGQMFSNQSNVTLSFSGNEIYNAPLIGQGLEGYSRDLGFDRNTVQDSGKRKIA